MMVPGEVNEPLEPRYFELYELGLAYQHVPHGDIEALACYIEAALTSPELPYAHHGEWTRLESVPVPHPLRRLAQLRAAQRLYASSGQITDALKVATSLGDLRRHEAIVELLEPLAQDDVTRAAVFGNLATSQRYLRRYDDALPNYERAIALEPDATRRYYWFANALWELGEHERVVEVFERAPSSDEAKQLLTMARVAWSYVELGRHTDADGILRSAERVLYDASHDHASHAVEGGLVRLARARFAASRSDDAAIGSVRAEIARENPYLHWWLKTRGWLDDLSEEVLPDADPESAAHELWSWVMIEGQGLDGRSHLFTALDACEQVAEGTGDLEFQADVLIQRAMELVLHGQPDDALVYAAQIDLAAMDEPFLVPLARWLAAFALEDAVSARDAVSAISRLTVEARPALETYTRRLEGAEPADVAAPLRELYGSLRLLRPPRVPEPVIMGPVYAAGRNEPCPCGSGRKFKRCHGA